LPIISEEEKIKGIGVLPIVIRELVKLRKYVKGLLRNEKDEQKKINLDIRFFL